ncbi:putative Acid phosphatase [Rosa chinensis]|uniref:Putative Acid phosphatase n=1 Tax=Rosa chinensis TaxID=74649 RepID=A0A2P6RJW9_ROSCH|nr:acid phosphatase 1 [Rosa chinensis]PRQ46736.1 putative Acid phosphatase [Rosa chinensis]
MASSSSVRLLLLIVLVTIPASLSHTILQIPPNRHASEDRKLRADDNLFCDSWRFSVETNDAGTWDSIPSRCVGFVQDYMTGSRYASDSAAVANFSLAFGQAVKLGGDGKDAWVFDIDETLLSNLPYYEAHGFGSVTFDEEAFDEWVDLAEAPAIPASLNLYKGLQRLGFKIFLLTGRSEFQRNATVKNLLYSGYSDWERLLLRGPSDKGTLATEYKSKKRAELITEGYRLHGSSGDQWSDLSGFAVARRSFKLPNPMYYIA